MVPIFPKSKKRNGNKMTALLWKLASLFVEILLEQFQLIELVIVKLHTVITGQISQLWWQIFLKTIQRSYGYG